MGKYRRELIVPVEHQFHWCSTAVARCHTESLSLVPEVPIGNHGVVLDAKEPVCKLLPSSVVTNARGARMNEIVSAAIEREVSDEGLMARYADGDLEAFEELFNRYEPRAYSFFLRRTASPDRAEDLYQELFLRIHRARDRYDPERPFAAWFFQIANRLLVDDWRRAYRSHEVSIGNRQVQSSEASDEERFGQRELLAQTLDELSPDERYVLVSAKLEGISYAELAEHLGKSVDAVKKMASRATKRLRSEVAAEVPV